MKHGTGIEWTHFPGTKGETWNVVTGCSKISPACENCYAERMSHRLAGRAGYPKDNPFRVTLHEDRLDKPHRWTKPRTVFVVSMGDLFHKKVPFEYIGEIMDVITATPKHTYMILTKRIKRALAFHDWMQRETTDPAVGMMGWQWPENAGLGITAATQYWLDKRTPILFDIPAAWYFVSLEPWLERKVDLSRYLPQVCAVHNTPHSRGRDCLRKVYRYGFDFVIGGGESGPGARVLYPQAMRDARDQCKAAANVPFFFKQWGEWLPKDQEPPGFEYSPRDYRFRGEASGPSWRRVGKRRAGAYLDGETHHAFPNLEAIKVATLYGEWVNP
jgi:protein gp37